MKSWLWGMPEQIPADSMQRYFHPKLIFPLCFRQSVFSYPNFLKGYSDGLKTLFTSRAVHLFMPGISSLNGVCSCRFGPEAPTHRLPLAKEGHQPLPRKSFRVPPATCRERLRCWSPVFREAPLLIRVHAPKSPCQGTAGTSSSLGPRGQ